MLNPTFVFHIEVVESDSIWENANLGHILLLDLHEYFDPIWKIANLGHIPLLDLHGYFDPIWKIANLSHILLQEKEEICDLD